MGGAHISDLDIETDFTSMDPKIMVCSAIVCRLIVRWFVAPPMDLRIVRCPMVYKPVSVVRAKRNLLGKKRQTINLGRSVAPQ
jgi:hypothetical protein